MKVNFNDNIDIRFTGEGKAIRLNPLWVRTRVFNQRLNLQDHEYFTFRLPSTSTDGASIPRLVWAWLSPFDWRILCPSQPHDYMYDLDDKVLAGWIYDKAKSKTIGKKINVNFDRKEADKVIREKMRSYGSGAIARFLVYLAVRLGGWKSF